MKLIIIATIIASLLIIAGFVAAGFMAEKTAETAGTQEKSCCLDNSCTAGNSCGRAECGIVSGKKETCGCRK